MEVVYTSFSLPAARCLVQYSSYSSPCCFLPYSWPAAVRSSLLTASHCFVLASCSLLCCYSFSCPSLSSCFLHCSGFLPAALCVVPLTPAQLLAQYVVQVIITCHMGACACQVICPHYSLAKGSHRTLHGHF